MQHPFPLPPLLTRPLVSRPSVPSLFPCAKNNNTAPPHVPSIQKPIISAGCIAEIDCKSNIEARPLAVDCWVQVVANAPSILFMISVALAHCGYMNRPCHRIVLFFMTSTHCTETDEKIQQKSLPRGGDCRPASQGLNLPTVIKSKVSSCATQHMLILVPKVSKRSRNQALVATNRLEES